MKRSTLFTAVVAFVCCLLLTVETKAQGVSGYTSIDYNPDTNTVDAYSETDLDIDLTCDYDAKVSMGVYDQNWHLVNHIYTAQDDTGFGVIAVEEQFSATADFTYTAIGSHTAVADLSDQYDFSPYQTFWYDDYYLSYFVSQGIDSPWYYYFLSPGLQETELDHPNIDVGSTYDSDSVTTPAQKPGSLTVLSVTVLPTGTSGDYGCTPGNDYGIKVAVKYQVNDQSGQPLSRGDMRPQEKVTNATFNGSSIPDPQPTWNDIGPSRNSQTSRTTNANGQFVDAPYGACNGSSFTHTFKQSITILIGSNRYSVRTNNVTLSSSANGAGSLDNGSDIQASRP
jgi:hypothetical protein